MTTPEYYTRQKDAWTEDELQDLKEEYIVKEFTIMQMGILHKRTPGAIGYKLKSLKIIESHLSARGYNDYRNSDLYKNIVANNPKNKEKGEKPAQKPQSTLQHLQTPQPLPKRRLSYEIQELREEIKSVKDDVKEMLRLMNALYEFESKEVA